MCKRGSRRHPTARRPPPHLALGRHVVNQIMITEEGGIPPLLHLLSDKASPASQEKATKALWHLADTEDNKFLIPKAGGIAPLVALLTGGSETTQQYARPRLVPPDTSPPAGPSRPSLSLEDVCEVGWACLFVELVCVLFRCLFWLAFRCLSLSVCGWDRWMDIVELKERNPSTSIHSYIHT